jgi:hypothetical protein
LASSQKVQKTSMKYKYAEEWLDNAVQLLEPVFNRSNYEIPRVRALLSFPIDGLIANRKRQPYLGQCLSKKWTDDEVVTILITPISRNPISILTILLHELAHSIDDCKSHHGDVFREICTSIGLEFYGDDDYPSEELLKNLQVISKELGSFPALNISHSTLKVEMKCCL